MMHQIHWGGQSIRTSVENDDKYSTEMLCENFEKHLWFL